MRAWVCCLSLLFAVSGWAQLPVPPPDMPPPPVVRTVDVRADETPVSVAAWHVEARVGGAFATVTTWFERDRPRAMLVVTLAAGFASTIFLPLSAWLVSALGWRA